MSITKFDEDIGDWRLNKSINNTMTGKKWVLLLLTLSFKDDFALINVGPPENIKFC